MASNKSVLSFSGKDGKTTQVTIDHDKYDELNKALNSDQQFQLFAKDPKSFTSKFGLLIDDDLSNQLKMKLQGFNNRSDLEEALKKKIGEIACTAIAWAEGHLAVTSTKIAAVI